MTFSKHSKCLLIVVLVLLNFIIRIPSVPHEIGVDSVTVHILANSVSTSGFAGWWTHPSSIFGFYPYSYASAVPFVLSGICQCTGIEMEVAIWIFCIIIGLFSAFTAYLLAGVIWDNDIFKFFVAFTYSLSPGILAFTTWDVSTRGLFVVLSPLFIYLLLKTRTSVIKFSILSLILFVLLMATHHYIFMTIPIIFSFIIFVIFYRSKRYIKSIKISDSFVNVVLILSFFGMFSMPFFTHFLMSGGRYDQLLSMLSNNIRYVGVLFIFAISGLFFLLLKDNKRQGEWFFLLTLLFFMPILYQKTYTHYFTLIFACILVGIGLMNVVGIEEQKRKYAVAVVIVVLLLSVSFSGFYQHWRTKDIAGRGLYAWYMEEPTYAAGLWAKDNMDASKKLVGYDELTGRRIFAISEVPTLVGMGSASLLTHGFTNLDNASVVMISPLSTAFYMENPYVVNSPIRNPEGAFFHLGSQKFDSWYGKETINTYNLSYAIEHEHKGKNTFIQSLYEKKNSIYSNGIVRVWCLD